jgi:hypothetical protein
MSDEHAPIIKGLPGPLPAGEDLIWQGSPRWSSLALRAYHVGLVGVYFAGLFVWEVATALSDGQGLVGALAAARMVPLMAAGAIGILVLLAWASARTTIYTLTSKRLVIETGIALTMTLNVPFKVIESAALKVHRDGTGDIPFKLVAGERIGYTVLWPSARRWRLRRPEPMIRGIADPQHVAMLAANALRAAAGQPVASPVRKPAETPGRAAPAHQPATVQAA